MSCVKKYVWGPSQITLYCAGFGARAGVPVRPRHGGGGVRGRGGGAGAVPPRPPRRGRGGVQAGPGHRGRQLCVRQPRRLQTQVGGCGAASDNVYR